MSEENKYSIESMVDINPLEHMRYRPAMYIGRVDELGNIEIVKALFNFFNAHSEWNEVHFTYISENSFKITFDSDLNFELSTKYFLWLRYSNSVNDYLFRLIVGLSEKCNIRYKENDLCFVKGELISESKIKTIDGLSIIFSFDTTILHSDKLPKHLLFNLFKRYSFLYPEREILVFENEANIASFSSNGMQDWFETQIFDATLLMQPFHISIEDDLLDLKAEIVFSIHNEKESFSTITLPRADFIRDNGTHAVGFLKGLQNSIRKIIGEDYTEPIFSEYRNPIGVFKVSYPAMAFHGPTRNEVGNEELVEIFESITQKKLLANEGFTNAILTLFNIK